MYDKLCVKVKPRRYDRLAGLNGRKAVAGRLQPGSARRLENSAANAAAHREMGIGGVDNGVDLHFRYILPDNGKGHQHTSERIGDCAAT
jgi:hypothetical protein